MKKRKADNASQRSARCAALLRGGATLAAWLEPGHPAVTPAAALAWQLGAKLANYMNANDAWGFPGLPRGGVGGRSSLTACSRDRPSGSTQVAKEAVSHGLR